MNCCIIWNDVDFGPLTFTIEWNISFFLSIQIQIFSRRNWRLWSPVVFCAMCINIWLRFELGILIWRHFTGNHRCIILSLPEKLKNTLKFWYTYYVLLKMKSSFISFLKCCNSTFIEGNLKSRRQQVPKFQNPEICAEWAERVFSTEFLLKHAIVINKKSKIAHKILLDSWTQSTGVQISR